MPTSKHDDDWLTHLDPVPSYEESVGLPTSLGQHTEKPSSAWPPLSLSLQQQLHQTRSGRVHGVLADYIKPLLVSQGLDGIHRRVFVLIPSDLFPSQQTELSGSNLV